MDKILEKAIAKTRESKDVEFKSSFDVKSPGDWCEIIKDIIAMTNSGGGVIVFGLDDTGNPTEFNVNEILKLDNADITNKISKYIDLQFTEFELHEYDKKGYRVALLKILPSEIPIIFNKPGTYLIENGKQKKAFSQGTIYFRHGAKSEPGNNTDLRKSIERQIKRLRTDWLKGLRKVVTAPKGAEFIIKPTEHYKTNIFKSIQIVDDPKAPKARLTRDIKEATGEILYERISENLLDEVNNVMSVNSLLAKQKNKFLLGEQIYHVIYADRNNVEQKINQFELLASTGLNEFYGAVYYWIIHLSNESISKLLFDSCKNPKNPYVYNLIRLFILLGSDATEWLYQFWINKWPYPSDRPDCFWALEKVISLDSELERRLVALKTIPYTYSEFRIGDKKHSFEELYNSSELSSFYLTHFSLNVFKDESISETKKYCRYLDVLTYGHFFANRGVEIINLITKYK